MRFVAVHLGRTSWFELVSHSGETGVREVVLCQTLLDAHVSSIYFTLKACFMPSLTCVLPVFGSVRKQTSV